jgi:predicted nucleic acid-binding protein
MSIFYIDSSAWIKRYFLEDGSPAVEEMFERSQFLACSILGYVEVAATVARKKKSGDLSQSEYEQIRHGLKRDWADFYQIPLDDTILVQVELALSSALRGADAVHLASALYLQKRFAGNAEMILVSSDKALNEAAQQLQVRVIDPVFTPRFPG